MNNFFSGVHQQPLTPAQHGTETLRALAKN